MSSPTDRRPHACAPAPPARRPFGVLVAVALTLAGAFVLGFAGVPAAASVSPVGYPGPTGCPQLADRFGGGPYTEVRFATLPDVGAAKAATRGGVTVTVRRLSPSTMAWQATAGVDLVFVNAGTAPDESSAVYRYDPEATSDSGLRGTNPSDVLDHVVVCFDDAPITTTTAATTTAATTTTVAEPVTTTTLMVPIVSCAYPPTCQIANTTTTTATEQVTTKVRPSVAATTTVAFRLPETGADRDQLAVIGLALLGAGLAALVLAGWLRSPATGTVAARHRERDELG